MMANYEKGNRSCMYTKIRDQTGKGIREPTGKGGVSTVMANYEKETGVACTQKYENQQGREYENQQGREVYQQ